VPGFISALRRQNGQAARALELLVLTVTRSNEMLGASWDEIDLIDNVWVIPGSRMKMGKEHRIPLSDAAVSLLGALPGPHVGLVFPGRTPTKPMHHGRLREIDLRGATVHGFRSSFRDWAAECGHYPSEVIEPCLAHAVGSVTERSYLRSDLLDRRRRLMNDWSTFCSGSTREHSELIELKRA
jgi:integrase